MIQDALRDPRPCSLGVFPGCCFSAEFAGCLAGVFLRVLPFILSLLVFEVNVYTNIRNQKKSQNLFFIF